MSGKSDAIRSGAHSVLYLSGYGVTLGVERGALVLRDGIADRRRELRIQRAQRTTTRIVVNSTTGSISLAALRWCADVKIAVVCLDPITGEALALNAPETHDDARLRRAQAVHGAGKLGLAIARELVQAKINAQGQTTRFVFGDCGALEEMAAQTALLTSATDVDLLRNIEANAALAYFRTWRGFPIPFSTSDSLLVPPEWLVYSQRTSPISSGKSPRGAVDPLNAMLNYCYSLLEVEAVLACHTLGLDPGLGVLHRDKKGRASLALDLIEPVRPAVDRYVLELCRSHVFTRRDFAETRTGSVVLCSPVAGQLAATAPHWARRLATHAESVAHAFVGAAQGDVRVRRPLSGKQRGPRKSGREEPPMASPGPRCSECGDEVHSKRQRLCGPCNNIRATAQRREQAKQSTVRMNQLRLEGRDPRTSPEAISKKRESLIRNRAALKAWEAEHPDVTGDPDNFMRQIQPLLSGLSVAAIERALDVSSSTASKIRSGRLVPHLRHWETLASIAQAAE